MSTRSTVTLRASAAAATKADAVVVGIYSNDGALALAAGSESIADAMPGLLATLDALGASSTPGDVTKVPGTGGVKAPVVVAAGMGSSAEPSAEALRLAGGAAARALPKATSIAFALPAEDEDSVQAVVEGALMGGYVFDRYLESKAPATRELVVLTPRARAKAAADAARAAQVIADAVNFTRDLVNTPPNDLYPESFADELRNRAKGNGSVSVTVLDEKQLATKGYGGILGVGTGSARKPRLVKLSYRPTRATTHLALVGKGITFDSGGLSLKQPAGMTTMKCDMAGAAAISAALFAIAELGLPIRVTGYACLAENMPGGGATRPGDVLTMFGGTTVEVLNTDAEGRLVLADGIVTAGKEKADLIVDVATLTGACMIALGRHTSGVFSNDDTLHRQIPDVAETAGERMWAMPISDEMREKVHTTKIAQLSQHNPEPWGGAMFAAAFLREFVPAGTPWAHLDIAGPAFNDAAPNGYTPKGGTGAAVRTLIALARERS